LKKAFTLHRIFFYWMMAKHNHTGITGKKLGAGYPLKNNDDIPEQHRDDSHGNQTLWPPKTTPCTLAK
jgi:hypothetical protein